jgi:hypothetical protein
MRLLKETLGILVALVIVAVILAFVAPNRARAVAATLVQIVPGNTTHVGQPESRLVSLHCFPYKASCSEVDAEGNVDESTDYVVPKGYTLIVTDYLWQAATTSTGLIGDALYDNSNDKAFNSSIAEIQPSGQAFANEHYTTGIRVASGVTLGDELATTTNTGSLVQGYLVPND